MMYEIDEITNIGNQVKSCVISGLMREGIIDKEQADRIDKEYAVILIRKDTMGNSWNEKVPKSSKGDNHQMGWILVKHV